MSSENDEGALIVELRGEVFHIKDFTLTFGEAMQAKVRARRSARNQEEEMAHEIFWLVRKIFEKNDLEKDVEWLRNVPMKELRHVLRQMAKENPGFGPKYD